MDSRPRGQVLHPVYVGSGALIPSPFQFFSHLLVIVTQALLPGLQLHQSRILLSFKRFDRIIFYRLERLLGVGSLIFGQIRVILEVLIPHLVELAYQLVLLSLELYLERGGLLRILPPLFRYLVL